jgi:hypothetical protein
MNDFFEVVFALTLATVLNLLIVRRIRSLTPPSERRLLSRVFWWTIALRYSVALFLNVYANDPFGLGSQFATMFWGDSSTYDFGGFALSSYWNGDTLVDPLMSSHVSGWGFYYVVGAIYRVFGHNQMLVQFFNGSLGTVTAFVIYAIAKDLFGIAPARWALKFMAFFPQMVFWSTGIYKDPSIMLCIAICMYSVIRLSREWKLQYLFLYVLASICIIPLRFYIFYMVVFATLSTFLVAQRRAAVSRLASQVFMILVIVLAFGYGVNREQVSQQLEYFDLRKVQLTRADQAHWSSTGYGQEYDVSTTSGALAALPKGILFLLFSPFPWMMGSMRQMLTLPETLAWYGLMPALWRGLRYTVRERFRDALPILAFATILTLAYAIYQGNVGTAYRQRTQITMFFFIFMGVGLAEKEKTKEQKQRYLRRPIPLVGSEPDPRALPLRVR